MNKKLIIALAAGAALTGCAHRDIGPALVGGVIGYAIARDHEPRPVHSHQTVIVQQQTQIKCPPGLAQFWTRRFDRNGREYLEFDGCR